MDVLGVLTAGGDCPGLNAVVRAVVTRAIVTHGMEVVGVQNGWDGLMAGDTRTLDRDSVRGILGRGGMGTVYLGERVDGDFAQRVAIKLIRRGLDTARAMQSACREMIRAREQAGLSTHPFHWAGFTAAGEWR